MPAKMPVRSPTPSRPGQGTKRRRSPERSLAGEVNPKHQRRVSRDQWLRGSISRMSLSSQNLSSVTLTAKLSLAEQSTTDLVQKIVSTHKLLSAANLHNSDVEDSIDNDLAPFSTAKPQYPSIKPVALIGSSGTGKSSFLNSLLGHSDAAFVSGTDRGTFVVHEYLAGSVSQECLYLVVASYLSAADIWNAVETHVDRLICAHSSDSVSAIDDEVASEGGGSVQAVDAASDENDQQTADALMNELNDKRRASLVFFHGLLCDYEEFASISATEAWFRRHRNEQRMVVVDHLAGLIEALKQRRDLKDDQEKFVANTEAELDNIYRRLCRPPRMAEVRRPLPHPHAILTKVSIYLQNDLLETGVVLADPPGLNDNNGDIVETTKQYMKVAGTILVFTALERATNSPELDMHLRRVIREGKMHHIRLVVTKIDRVDPIRRQDWVDLLEHDLEQVRSAEAAVERLEAQKQQLLEDLDKAKSIRNVQRWFDLEQAKETLEADIDAAEANKRQLHIKIRTRDQRMALKGKLRDLARLPNAPDLPIHFVSNSEHLKHLGLAESREPLRLDVQTAGILQLQSTIRKDIAGRKLHALEEAARYAIPGVLSSLSGTFHQSQLSKKQQVEDLIKDMYAGARALLPDVDGRLDEPYVEYVEGQFARHKGEWKQAASDLIDYWGSPSVLRPITFKAFCKHDGYWTRLPTDLHRISWNQSFQDIMKDDVAAALDRVDGRTAKVKAGTIEKIEKLFVGLLQALQESGHFDDAAAAEDFYKEVQAKRDSIVKDVKGVFNQFTRKINSIRNQLLVYVPIDNDGRAADYISLFLKPIYKKCRAVQGKLRAGKSPRLQGAHKLRVVCLKEGVLGSPEVPSLFDDVLERATKDWHAGMEGLNRGLKLKFKKGEKSLLESLKRRFVETADAGSIVQRDSQVLEQAKKTHGEMERELEGLKAKLEDLKTLHRLWKVDDED